MEQGFVIWFTGLPASGKTTAARALQARLRRSGVASIVLDSDDMRPILTPNPTYSAAERDHFYLGLVELAGWLAGEGVNVLVAATAHLQRYRRAARDRIRSFALVHIATQLAVCQARDPKGLYAAAAAGDAPDLPGVGVAYEPPDDAEATLDLAVFTPAEAADSLCRSLDLLRPACGESR